jgi:hypothetical protein
MPDNSDCSNWSDRRPRLLGSYWGYLFLYVLKRHEGGIFLFLTLIMAHCKFLFLSWKRWRSTWEPRSYGLISLLFYMYKCICTDIFYKLNTVNQIIFMDTFFTFKCHNFLVLKCSFISSRTKKKICNVP